MEKIDISRRSFLTGAAAAGALGALGLAGCAPQAADGARQGKEMADTGSTEAIEAAETTDCDVVIVGAGGSGLAAAVEAGESGMNTIVVESQPQAGGGAIGIEGVFGVGSSMQKERGIEISIGQVIRHERESGQNRPSGPAQVALAHASGSNIDWLIAHGVEFDDVIGEWTGQNMRFYHHYAHSKGSEDYVPHMLEAAEKAGVQFMYNTPAIGLVTTDEGVRGVYVTKEDGTVLQINAPSVILATGGFAGNFDMVAESGINTEGAKFVGMPGSDGSGHKMAVEAGAISNRHSTCYLNAFGFDGLPDYFNGGVFSFMIGIQSPFTVWLNQDAQRFTNEDFSVTNAMAMTLPAWRNKATWMLMDQAMMDLYTKDADAASASDEIAKGIDLGCIVKADTLDELASGMNMDAAQLKATIDHYNEYCAAGDDADFGKSKEFLMTVGDGPYYGLNPELDVQVSIGSIETDLNYNALDAQRNPIDGLYVVGVEGAMLWANIYTFDIPCECNANNIHSGRVAAQQALKRI